MRRTWRGATAAAGMAVLAAAMVLLPQVSAGQAGRGRGRGRGGGNRAAAASTGEVTDAQVVAAMRKGIDFLLANRHGDNWEIPGYKWPGNGEVGGVTGVTVYALLNAGDSLQDDPDYHAKLHWRSKEMQPAIQWLSKNMPVDTYAAALEASALTLVPKLPGQKPEEGAGPALDACKWYLLSAMGADGGYSYTVDLSKFDEACKAYIDAAARGDLNGKAKTELDNQAKALYENFGGPELGLQKEIHELQMKQRVTKDANELKKIAFEILVLDNYLHQFPRPADDRAALVSEKKNLAGLLSHNGNPAGLTTTDSKTKKKRAMTKEELDDEVKQSQRKVAQLEEQAKGEDPRGDLSNGQYGALGAWALADFGLEFPDMYWQVQDRFWRYMQNPDGGWPYNRSSRSDTSPTMSLAGIASLFVCQEFTDDELRLIPKPDKNIDAGLAWLVKNYQPSVDLYYMYGVERVGLASGLKFFGTTDWYKTGAAAVVKRQAADGSWEGGFYGGNQAAVGTSYALLFLSRGRNPVMFNKLEYPGRWNARPRDDAYVTRWMSKRFEKPINWQVVNLQVDAEEWLDAPVLLITGSLDPKFSKEDIAKLRAFIDAGGMIFSSSDGNSVAFTNAMRKCAGEVVDGKYEMRQLPRNHELFSQQLGVSIPNPPPVLGMSNGSREIWIHSQHDLGADWQMRRYANKTSFELAAAVYLYASGMGSLRSKLQPLAVADTAAAASRTIEVARIDYAGNSDPEPGAWARMGKLAQADFKTQVNVSTVKFADLDPRKFALAHLTGTAKMTWAPEEVKALKAYVEGGGLVFMDAAGGSSDFAGSCRELIREVYPDTALEPVPPDHPLLTGAMADGVKLSNIEFRKFGNLLLQRRVSAPALEQIATGGRTRIVFSQWDVCSGFLGTNTWGIVGYAPASSVAIGRNILLYALQPNGAATQPSGAAMK